MASDRTGQRHVAGLWCDEVLERLPDLVDGMLSDADRARVEVHVGGCDWCEKFGGAYGATVGALRRGEAPAAPEGLAERLHARLAADLPDQD